MKKELISIIPLFLALLFSVSALFMTAYAWFSYNDTVSAAGMQVVVIGDFYDITAISDSANDGAYYTIHNSVKGADSVFWKMTEDNNILNYTDGGGIMPGMCGVISFNVVPKAEQIDLDFQFDILGYAADESASPVIPTQRDPDEGPARYLNGHILLFEGRTGSEGNYTYTDPILSNEDMKRVLLNRHFTGEDSNNPVNIYWVWPGTLSELIDARACEKIEVPEAPITSGNALSAINANILAYPWYYFKNIEAPASGNGSGEVSGDSGIGLTTATIVRDYDIYSDYYDQADNDIGTGIQYLLLRMTVKPSAVGSESSGE